MHKRHYTAIAVPTWRMLVSPCREPAKVNADGLTPERRQLMVFGCLDVIESVQAAGRGCY